MRRTGFWGISYQLSVVRRVVSVGGQQSVVSNQKEWQSTVSSIRGRDREIAPTKSGQRSAISGRQSAVRKNGSQRSAVGNCQNARRIWSSTPHLSRIVADSTESDGYKVVPRESSRGSCLKQDL